MGRTKNASRNIIWGIINKVVSLVLPFICRTVLLYEMGAEYTGLGGLFGSVLQVLSLAELGFGTAIVYSMYKPLAEEDTPKVCALLNFYKKVYHIVGALILAIGVILVPFLQYLIKGTSPEGINIYVLYSIYLFNSVISYFLFSYKCSLLIAAQRNDISLKIGLFVTTAMYAGQIAVIILFHNYYVFALVMPLMTIINNIVTAQVATRRYPQYVCRGQLDKSEIKILKDNTTAMLFYKIGDVIQKSFDNIVVSAFMGLSLLTVFQNYNYIQTSVAAFLTMIVSSILASVGNSIAVESVEKNYRDFNKFTLIYMLISGWGTVCMVCLYQPVMKLWVGEELLLPMELAVLFAVYFYAARIGDICYTYRQAAGLWKYDKWRPIIESVTNLALNIWWIQTIGMSGVLLSTIVCSVFITFTWGTIVLFKYYFGKSPRHYVASQIYYALMTVIVCGITYRCCEFVTLDGMAGILVRLVICAFIPAIAFWVMLFWRSEYKDAKDFVFGKLLHGSR